MEASKLSAWQEKNNDFQPWEMDGHIGRYYVLQHDTYCLLLRTMDY